MNRDKHKKKILTLVFLLISAVFSFSSSFPFPPDVSLKNDGAYFTPFPENGAEHIKPLQSHVGEIVTSFNVPDNSLYNFYLEKYRAPQWLMWLKTVSSRADIYIDFIDMELAENDMPPELLYLPVVESAYRFNAVSVAGATGLWQFMKNSIAPYDISVNEWMDERRDFWKTTKGAVAKLRYNYSVLGDWMLAIAAYNCGLGRVQRTIAASGIDDFWELAERGLLPKETVHYIPRFLAISRIMMYSGRENVSDSWREPVRWERIRLSDSVSLSRLAEKAALPYSLIKLGNPELNYDITPPGSYNYYLKIPSGSAGAVETALADREDSLMRFYIYKIKAGDTLYDLSRHYGVSVSMIRSYNRSVDPGRLMIDQKILVPAVKEVPYYSGKRSSASERRIDDKSDYIHSYVVKTGDTLWDIAKRHGTDPYNVAYHNGIDIDSVLSVGMQLKVPETDS